MDLGVFWHIFSGWMTYLLKQNFIFYAKKKKEITLYKKAKKKKEKIQNCLDQHSWAPTYYDRVCVQKCSI